MEEYLTNAKNEFKRVDHLLYVTLKYTRTVDVIKSIIERFVSTFDFCIEGILQKVKKRKKTLEIPPVLRQKCELLKKLFPKDKALIEFIDFYIMLRDILQAGYGKKEEYRRHVTMISHVKPDRPINVDIDKLYEYYDFTHKFLEYFEYNFVKKKKII